MQTYQPSLDLTQLRDVVAPVPVSYLPQTAGWYVLGFVGLAFVAWIAWRWLEHRRRNAYRREALGALNRIEASLAGGVAEGIVGDVDALAKRVALVAFGREAVASLAGDDWLAFLDRTNSGRSKLRPYGASPSRTRPTALTTTPNTTPNTTLSTTLSTTQNTTFTTGDGRPLGDLPYRKVIERQALSIEQAKALTVAVRRWIRGHRVPV